jgi:hypothetical protein
MGVSLNYIQDARSEARKAKTAMAERKISVLRVSIMKLISH